VERLLLPPTGIAQKGQVVGAWVGVPRVQTELAFILKVGRDVYVTKEELRSEKAFWRWRGRDDVCEESDDVPSLRTTTVHITCSRRNDVVTLLYRIH